MLLYMLLLAEVTLWLFRIISLLLGAFLGVQLVLLAGDYLGETFVSLLECKLQDIGLVLSLYF